MPISPALPCWPVIHCSALFLPRHYTSLSLTKSTVQNEIFPCFLPCLSLAARSCLVPEFSYSSSSSEVNRARSSAAHPTSLCATKGGKIFQQGLVFFFSVNTSEKEKRKKKRTMQNGGVHADSLTLGSACLYFTYWIVNRFSSFVRDIVNDVLRPFYSFTVVHL